MIANISLTSSHTIFRYIPLYSYSENTSYFQSDYIPVIFTHICTKVWNENDILDLCKILSEADKIQCI